MKAAKLQTVSCPNCNTDSWRVVARPVSHSPQIEGQFSIVCCTSCHLRYLNPRPDRKSLGEFYEILQAKSSLQPTDETLPKRENWLKQSWHRLNYSNPLLSMIDQTPVLDIGCGRGELIADLVQQGYEAHGLEFDSFAVADCLKKGLKVTQGSIEDFELPKNYYKCIVLSHTLEHLIDPVATLRKIAEALPSCGKLAIAVPYVNSPMVKLFGDAWHGWDPPFHLLHFDKNTMQQICQKAGLNLTKTKVGGHPEDFTRSLAIRTGKRDRHLVLRAALWPLFLAAEVVGQGSYLLAIAEKRT
jgi:SAM-dependent methyltransferase